MLKTTRWRMQLSLALSFRLSPFLPFSLPQTRAQKGCLTVLCASIEQVGRVTRLDSTHSVRFALSLSLSLSLKRRIRVAAAFFLMLWLACLFPICLLVFGCFMLVLQRREVLLGDDPGRPTRMAVWYGRGKCDFHHHGCKVWACVALFLARKISLSFVWSETARVFRSEQVDLGVGPSPRKSRYAHI